MKKLILIPALLLFTGCATSSVQTGPTYLDWQTGKKKFDAKIVLADTGLFTPSTADTLLKECLPPVSVIGTDPGTGERRVVQNDLEDEELLAVSRCQAQADIAHDTNAGAAASFVAPVLNSAAIAYVGHELGKGIGKSGDRTTNSNSSSNKNSQKQGQGQGQNAEATGGKGQGGKGGEASGGNTDVDVNSNANSNSNSNANSKSESESEIEDIRF